MATSILRVNSGPISDVTFTAVPETGGFNMAVYAGALLMVKSVTGGATTLTFYCKERENDSTTYLACNSSGDAITLTIAANKAFALPDDLFAAHYVFASTDQGEAVCRVIVKG